MAFLKKWGIPLVLLLAIAFLAGFSPAERTLGQGIKTVYIHVAVTWTAMLLIIVLGVLGLVVAMNGSPKLDSWVKTLLPPAFGFYLLSSILGAWSSKVNWGAVGWNEPRMQATFQILAVAVVVTVFSEWLNSPRARGLLTGFWLVFMFWALLRSPLILHPANPILTSSSVGIQVTFFGMFALVLALAVWIVWFLRRVVTPKGVDRDE